MSFFEALLLGLVEGVTEFLPISSTGHLLLVQEVLGIERGEAADAWTICVQGGAILAVLALYPARCKQVMSGFLGGDRVGRALGLNILVAFLPAALLGLLYGDVIRARLFDDLGAVAWAWLIGGVVLLTLGRRMRPGAGGDELSRLTLAGAFGVGVLQCVAFWPGTSRSLVTILGCVLVGLSLAAAVEFSFLLGLVTLLAASVYEAWGAREALGEYSLGVMLTGFIAAFGSAALAMRGLVAWVRGRGLAVFGWYRIALGVSVLVWLERAL